MNQKGQTLAELIFTIFGISTFIYFWRTFLDNTVILITVFVSTTLIIAMIFYVSGGTVKILKNKKSRKKYLKNLKIFFTTITIDNKRKWEIRDILWMKRLIHFQLWGFFLMILLWIFFYIYNLFLSQTLFVSIILIILFNYIFIHFFYKIFKKYYLNIFNILGIFNEHIGEAFVDLTFNLRDELFKTGKRKLYIICLWIFYITIFIVEFISGLVPVFLMASVFLTS